MRAGRRRDGTSVAAVDGTGLPTRHDSRATHYDILGVEATADLETIKRAWRVKVLLLHPDKHEGSSDEVRAEAAKEIQLVNKAWDTLKDPALRHSYDLQIARARRCRVPNGFGRAGRAARAQRRRHRRRPLSRLQHAAARLGLRRAVRVRELQHDLAVRRLRAVSRAGNRQRALGQVDLRTVRRGSHVLLGRYHEAHQRASRARPPNDVVVGTPLFRCAGCRREYQRCVCNHYTSFPRCSDGAGAAGRAAG